MGRMRNASTYAKEMFAISQAVSKWRQHLLGKYFTIRTDHGSLKNLLSQVIIQTPEQQTFHYKLLGFTYTIEYRPGKDNNAVDALSRVMEDEEIKFRSQRRLHFFAISIYGRYTLRVKKRKCFMVLPVLPVDV